MAERHKGNRRELRRRAPDPRSRTAIGRRALTVILVVVALALAAASTASGHSQRSSRPSAGQPQWILFTARSSGFGVEQIFRITPSGKGLKQLTKGATYPSQAPAFSPDGKRIAFAQLGAGIFSMNVDGSGRRALTTNGRDSFPAWSPDGKQIAFIRPLASGWKLQIMSASGAGERQLGQAPPAGRPSWTSRGLMIPTNGDLAKVDPRSGHVQKLFGATIDASIGMDTTAISPDLSTITFVGSRRLDPRDHGCGEGVACPTFALFTQDLRTHKAPGILLLNGGPASFSPDGKRIAFVDQNRLVLQALPKGAEKSIKTGKLSLTTGSPPVWQPR
jgi:Tol biopolymer transport system component